MRVYGGARRPALAVASLVAVGALTGGPLCAQDKSATGVFDGGNGFASARYRVESVDEDNALQEALASTLRTSAGFETNPDLAFGAFAEVEDVHAIGAEKFNSTTNGHTTYSVIPDPDGTELNQGYLSWHQSGFRARAGRQAIVLDNARFVGDVAFRQNQQTFDAATLQATTPGGSRFTYDYLWRVHRPLGDDNPLGVLDLRTHLLNYSLGRLNGDRLSAYAYLLEFAEQALVARSTQTFGISYDGSVDIGPRKILYRAEYASQSDYADNPVGIDVWYANAELGLRFERLWTVTAGVEVLSGDGTSAFQTPLATLHKFNGATDIFNETPRNGLEDRYVRVYAPVAGLRVTAAWHDFRSERGSDSYGREVDLGLEWHVTTHWLVGTDVADYRADTFATDTRKARLFVQADF